MSTDPHAAGEPADVSGVFARDIRALEDVFRLVERFFARSHLENELRYPVQFVLEEIFTNLVKYNAGGNADIKIDLGVLGDEVMMKITDSDSPRFDITADARDVDVTAPLEARSPGGLGIHLVKKMVDRIDYTHENRTGVLTLYKRMS